MSSSTFVSHDKVKAVELAPESTPVAVRLSSTKRERLLTVPRMQKATPPTHLIRSKNGDYLRGRVVLMDQKRLQVETRLESKDLPRDRISRIIWMHADEIDPSKKPVAGSQATRVQAVRNDGVRVTFCARTGRERHVIGQERRAWCLSRAHRRCGPVPLRQRHRGGGRPAHLRAMEAPERPRAHAPLRRTARAAATAPSRHWSASRPPTSSWTSWTGSGSTWPTAKGKVVVLDFWATWCGPCIQAMPQVEKAAGSFPEKDVLLVAVNLQEIARGDQGHDGAAPAPRRRGSPSTRTA